jgi:uncharacterized protein
MLDMNTVCHVEFDCTDLDRSQAFYTALFGWTFREFMGGEMRIFGVGDSHIGGLSKKASVTPGRSPSVWFQVEDLDRLIAAAESHGCGILEPKHPLPGVGFSACVADPDGNPVGLVHYT